MPAERPNILILSTDQQRADALGCTGHPQLRANYYGKISLIDDWLGQILQACAAKGCLDNLLIVSWSDHGEMLGDHQLLHKSHFFESSVRVPLLVSWPAKIRTGQHSDALVETLDIAPTVLEAAGIDIPARCMGKSLWPLLEEGADQVGFRDAAFSEIHFTPPWPGHPKMPQSEHRRNFMVRTDRYKYAVDETGQGYMLYDLDKDPRERNNLIGHPNERATENEMRDHLLKFLCRAHSVSGVAS